MGPSPLCDRLERFHHLRGQRWVGRTGSVPLRATSRSLRDRAMIYVLRVALRQARQGRIARVQGKGNTERTVFLSYDVRLALADYLERVRHRDAGP